MATVQDLLTEKLRPKRFEHLILTERVRTSLGNGRLMQNVLLYGSPGTGKTSAAKVLIAGSPNMYINVSDESSVDVIRTKITDFCSSIAIDFEEEINPNAPMQDNGLPIKVIILDEIDGASDQFFKALRATIEKYAKNCRFIATCNYINKIPESIQSRFECISFDFANKQEENEVRAEWKKRITHILDKIGITAEPEALQELVDRNFPDMRSILNKIQSFDIQGIKKITKDKVKEMNWDFEELYKILAGKPNPIDNYEFIMSNYSSMVEDVMGKIGTEFIHWLKEKHPERTKFVPNILITTADHQSKRHLVIDPIVCLLSLCFNVQKILNP